jgi:hypothetical protein
LSYNKARQAAITNEILEIVGGAEALNGWYCLLIKQKKSAVSALFFCLKDLDRMRGQLDLKAYLDFWFQFIFSNALYFAYFDFAS